jgi:hypothetical protein
MRLPERAEERVVKERTMTVRRTHGYSDTWEQFISGIYRYSAGQRADLFEQLAGDEKVGMILALSKGWTATQHRNSGESRRRQKQAAAAEAARLTPRSDAFVAYVSDQTMSQMPTPGVRRRDPRTRNRSTASASDYFRRLDRSTDRRIGRIIRNDLRLSPQQWACAHPYGPRVSGADLARYREIQVRPWWPRKKMAFNPAGMTPERALEIAMKVFG